MGVSRPSSALELHPCVWLGWNQFVLSDKHLPAVCIQVDLMTHPGGSHSFTPAGILKGESGKNDSYCLCSWPAGPPDRQDNFSVRWTGHWFPGETTCEIRLRADDRALLRLDGENFLQADHSPQGVTRTVHLSPKRHRFEVEYSESTDTAFIFVDWRTPGGSWGPLIPQTGDPGRELDGWLGEYYLDQKFTELAYTHIDPFIGFNWKDSGPFERAEDLPTLTWEWSHSHDRVLSQFISNRDGAVRLSFSSPGGTPFTLEGGNTFINLVPLEGETIRFYVDEPVTWSSSQSRSSNLPPSHLPPLNHQDAERISLEFPVKAGQPIRLWQPDEEHQTGSAAGQSIAQARASSQNAQFQIEGDFSRLNASLAEKSGWWADVLLSSSAMLASSTESAAHPGETPSPEHFTPAQVQGLIHAISSCCHLFFPGSPALESGLLNRQLPLLFKTSSPAGIASLQSALDHWSTCCQNNPGEEASPPSPPVCQPAHIGPLSWRTDDLASGLAQVINALAELSQIVKTTPDGLDFGLGNNSSSRMTLKNLKIGDRLWDISSNQWGARFEDKSGGFIQIDAVSHIKDLKVNKKGSWIADLEISGNEGRVAVGPSERIRSASWQKKPLLLLKGKAGEQQGKINGASGRLEIRFASEGETILPRY